MTTLQETALIHVHPESDLRIAALYEEGVKLQQYAERRIIQSDSDVKTATDDLSIIAKLKKAIEEKRKGYIDPINEHLKAVNEAFKRFVEPLTQAGLLNKGKIIIYRGEQERTRQEQERINQLREEAARAEMELKGEITEPVSLVEVIPEAPNRYRTETGTLSKALLWHFEVVDFSALPDDYKVADMVKIRKVVVAGATIPGVRSWKEESLRITAR